MENLSKKQKRYLKWAGINTKKVHNRDKEWNLYVDARRGDPDGACEARHSIVKIPGKDRKIKEFFNTVSVI